MRILFSLTNLSIGGAQMFVLNLAREFSQHSNYEVFIYDHMPEYSNQALYNYAGEKVKVLKYGGPIKRFFVQKINGFLKRIGSKRNFRDEVNRRFFLSTIKKLKIDLVNSQMSASDFICAEIVPNNIKFIVTLHGEYELYKGLNTPGINEKINAVLKRKPIIIYTADKNKTAIEDELNNHNLKAEKIYIGIKPETFTIKNISRSELNINSSDFVIGMVARGIPEKGWDLLISVFDTLKKKHSHCKLMLIGDGEYLRNLCQDKNNPNIILLQFEGDDYQNYFSYYKIFDVFVFPSFFQGESVPTVVAESLFWNIPVVANDIAEISNMITVNNKTAGYTVKIKNRDEMINEYQQILNDLINNNNKLMELKATCKDAFNQFEIKTIMNQYESLIN